YKDEYATALMKLIDRKIKAGGKEIPGAKRQAPAATNVVDLVKVLQESLSAAGKSKPAATRAAKPKKRATHRKRAA
ncbi:MAG: Ku protein, partial [Opitutaceae bacterium]